MKAYSLQNIDLQPRCFYNLNVFTRGSLSLLPSRYQQKKYSLSFRLLVPPLFSGGQNTASKVTTFKNWCIFSPLTPPPLHPFLLQVLELGANVNALSKVGYTALHLAVTYGNLDVARVLLRAGADVHVSLLFSASCFFCSWGMAEIHHVGLDTAKLRSLDVIFQ